jgi:hypothetical protein
MRLVRQQPVFARVALTATRADVSILSAQSGLAQDPDTARLFR